MTTIAYRDGVMLGDTRSYGLNDRTPVGRKTKVHRLTDGTLVGASIAVFGGAELLLRWVADGMRNMPGDWAPDFGERGFEVMVARPSGEVVMFDESLCPCAVEAPFFAVGSGKQYALAALHLGHSLHEAVALAVAMDVWSSPPLRGMTHSGTRIELRIPRGWPRAGTPAWPGSTEEA
jgi:hypothetical protein